MRDFWGKIVPSILTLIIGTFLGTYVKSWQDAKEKQIRQFDVRVQSVALVSRPDIAGQQLEILLNKKPIETLSQVTIEIYNRTDQDYEKVPVFIEVIPEDGSDLNVINEELRGANNIPESITRMGRVEQSTFPGGRRNGFIIETANRSNEAPVFSAQLLVVGKSTPKPVVTINKKGVQARMFNTFYFPVDNKWWQSEWVFFFIGMTVYATFIILAVKIGNKLKAKKQVAMKKILTEQFSKEFDASDSKVSPELIVNKVLTLEETYRWGKIPKWWRILLRIKQPLIENVSSPNSNQKD